MKTLFKQIPVLIAAGLITLSCSKDSPTTTSTPTAPNIQEENFLDGFLATSGFNQKTTPFVNDGTFEYGWEFEPLVKGKITSVKVKLPDVVNELRITIWDKMTGTALKTDIVNVTTVNTVFIFDIADLDVIKNKQYAITMNANDFYQRTRNDNSAVIYPITVGNIKILSNKYVAGSSQTYPTNELFTYCNGDLSFNFVKTE